MTAIRHATIDDAAAIAAIYAPFIEQTPITFETDPVGGDEMAQRIMSAGDEFPWFVAEGEGEGVLGYAYASRFRARSAYRFAVETSVYLDPRACRRGIGSQLYLLLLDTLRAQGFTEAIAAIALPNDASVALHEKFGFYKCGVYSQVGYKLGGWHDVGLWQCRLAEPTLTPKEPLKLSELAQRP
jgi:phosphinothricin acetyltransferase